MKPGRVSGSRCVNESSCMDLIPLLSACRLDDIARIDIGLEGDWSNTVQVVWTRNDGALSLEEPLLEHGSFKPSLELYFDNGWIGLHCFRRVGDKNVPDVALLKRVIGTVETALDAEAKREGADEH